MPFLQQYRWPLLLMFCFGAFWLAVLAGNHLHFGTSGWDLGIFQQNIYLYAHGIPGPNTVRRVPTLLADHFEPIMFLIAPLWWILREWTLFIVQIAATLFAGAGIYALLHQKEKPQSHWWALGGMTLFFVHWALLQGLVFDYHNNFVGAMLLPWLLWSIFRKRWGYLYVFAVLMLLTKETMSVGIAAAGFSMLWTRDKTTRYHGIAMIALGIIWYLMSVQVLIPFFNNGQYDHWNYEALGDSGGEAVLYILTHPLEMLVMLFDAAAKLQFWKYFVLSGGILLLRWPRLALLALPVTFMKLWSSEPNHWGIGYHYQPELAILTALAVTYTCMSIQRRYGITLMTAILSVNFIMSVQMPVYDSYTPLYRFIRNSGIPLQDWQHAAYEAIAQIPANASVSAQNTLIPHLADRRAIYLFPDYNDAEYVMLYMHASNVWPLADKESMTKAINDFEAKGTFEPIFNKAGIRIYKRISP